MLRAYTYKASDIGLESWPSGELRIEGTESVENPSGADLFICPGNLSMFSDGHGSVDLKSISKLPYFTGNESRHCFLDVSDNFTKAIGLPCIFIRCDVRSWMLKDDPNTLQLAWPVEDFGDCIPLPPFGFKYDVSFHGWNWSSARKLSTQSCVSFSRLTCDIVGYNDFTGYIMTQPEGQRRRVEFKRSMQESRVALCPESIPGVFPYRFFEAMSAGRVPVFVGSNAVLPFKEQIPYERFSLMIEATEAHRAATRIYDFLGDHPDWELQEMGMEARNNWERYLDCRKWPQIIGDVLRRRLDG